MREKLAHFLELHERLDTEDLTIPLAFLCYIYRGDIWEGSLICKDLDDIWRRRFSHTLGVFRQASSPLGRGVLNMGMLHSWRTMVNVKASEHLSSHENTWVEDWPVDRLRVFTVVTRLLTFITRAEERF